MIGKYLLNFLEQDLRDSYDNRQKPMQRKLNYVSGIILLIIQIILTIRMGIAYPDEFQLIYLSLSISIINIIINYKYQNISQILIFIQIILLNIQFVTYDHQEFIKSLLNNKSELFIIGLGYGHLNSIIFSTLQTWYFKSLTIFVTCVCGFFWSTSLFADKLTYLFPLYLSTIFAIIVFYFLDRYEKENFCQFYIQNKSLIDLQRIIKENIPQSMVFVTFPKKKSSNQIYQQSKVTQGKEAFNNVSSRLIQDKTQLKCNISQLKTHQTIPNPPASNLKFKGNGSQFIEEKDQSQQQSQKKGESDGLVFNFANKKFYDQFHIKELIENKRKSITSQFINSSLHYSFNDLINQDDILLKQGNLIGSEFPLHQILFNSIFRNIFISSTNHYESKALSDIDISADPSQIVGDTQNLQDFLKNFIEENKNADTKSQISKNLETSNNQQNRRSSYLQTNSVKQLNCFYKPSPFLFSGSQFLDANQHRSKAATHLPNQMQQQSVESVPEQSKQQSQTNKLKSDSNNQENKNLTFQGNEILACSSRSRQSKKLTANFGLQMSNRIMENKLDLEAQNLETLYGDQLNTGRSLLQTQRGEHEELFVIQENQIEQQQQKNNEIKKNIKFPSEDKPKLESKLDQDFEQQGEVQSVSYRQQSENSEQNIEVVQNEDKQQLFTSKNLKNSQQNNFERSTLKQVTFSGNSTQFKQNNQQMDQNQIDKMLNDIEKSKNNNAKYNNIVQSIVFQNQQEQHSKQNQKEKLDDTKIRNQNQQDGQDNALFFDTQMVRCQWGNEDGVLIIFNDVSLKIMNEKLREIERFKDKMLSTVTHDLKTPLNSIIMILENSFELGGLNKKQRKIILQNSQMLMSLINDILDYSQLRRDKFKLFIEEISLTSCIYDVVDLFEIQAEQKHIKITPSFQNLQQEYIMQDERRIKQILVNLIGNALKFTQQQGKIDVVVKQKLPDRIKISVQDSGTGISESIQKKLFQFFNTFDHSDRANNRHGIGLGLAICKQLNQQLGPWHEIKLKSKVDKGSKFTFCIYTNLIDHQQLASSVAIQNESNVKETALNQSPNIQNQPQQISDISNKKKMDDIQKVIELQQNDLKVNQSNLKDNTHYLQLPQSHNMSNIMSQNLNNFKSNNRLGGDENHAITENQQNNNKSNFHFQHELQSKSVNIPNFNTNINNKSIIIDEIQTESRISPIRHQQKDKYQTLQIIKRESSQTNKKSSFVGNVQSQQQSTSIMKSVDINGQIQQRPFKKDFIQMKGNKHKFLNILKPYTLQLVMEDLERKRGIQFHKSQTVDTSISKQISRSNRVNQNQGQMQSHLIFYSDKRIPAEGYPSLFKNDVNELGHPISNSKPLVFYSQTANNISTSIKNNTFSTNSNIISSIQNSDFKKLEKQRSQSNNNDNYKIKLNAIKNENLNQQQKQYNFYSQNEIKKVDMFVRVYPKNSIQKNSSFSEVNTPYLKDKDNEINQSENFGEIEELYKRIQTDFINEGGNKDSNNSQKRNQNNTYNDIHFAQSIPGYYFEQTPSSAMRKVELIKQSIPLPDHYSNYRFNKGQDDNQLSLFEKNTQLRSIMFDQPNKSGTPYQRNYKPKTEIQNNSHVEEEEDDDMENNHVRKNNQNRQNNYQEQNDVEMENDDEIEYDDDDDSQNNKEIGNNINYTDNKIQKQEIWIQNERKVQVEFLKNLLQDYQSALIADDSPFNIFCLEQILSKNNNLTITVAYNGNEAFSSYKQQRQQIIFMDLNMPVLDGYECLKCIRKYEQENNIENKTKVIVISAQEYEPFFSNFDGYLCKPIKLFDIINILQLFRKNQSNATYSQELI